MRAPLRLALALATLLSTLAPLGGCSGGDGRPDGCTRLLPSELGPGDVAGHFPLAVGDRWLYEETGTSALLRVEVTGERTVDGAPARVVQYAPADGSAAPEEELLRNGPSGVSVHASGQDPFPFEDVFPHLRLRWPMTAGESYAPVACAAIDAGEDLDGDGRHERVDVSIGVGVGVDEAVTVPAGTFTARYVLTRTTVTVFATAAGAFQVTVDEEEWLAPGVGRVRARVSLSGDLGAETSELVLAGYRVGGASGGLGDRRLLVPGAAPDREPIAVRAGDGGLVLAAVRDAAAERLATVRLDAAGGASAPADTLGLAGAALHAAAASSGAATLVATTICAEACDALRARRLGFDGAPLDPPPGALVATGSGATPLSPPAVASDGSGWLVAWASAGGGTHAARLGADGTPLGALALSSAETGPPRVAYAAGVYLVAFADAREGATRISGLRVSAAGTALDPAPFPITTAPGAKRLGGLASDGAQFLVVWADGRGGGAAGGAPALDVMAARVTPSGEVLDGPAGYGGLVVNALAGTAKLDPRVAFDGERFVVTWWIDGDAPPAGAYAARVSTAGALQDGPAHGTGLLVARSSAHGRARHPVAAPAPDGSTLVAWTEEGRGTVGAWYAW